MRSQLTYAVLFVTLGCLPNAKTSLERAHDAQAKCAGVSAASIEPVLTQSVIDSVDPAYDYALGGPNGRIARLAGAQVHLQPVQGASRQWVERALECHQAQVVLGLTCAAPDPYHAAAGWVDIDVQSDKDGYVVRLTSDDIDEAHAILERARTYARRL